MRGIDFTTENVRATIAGNKKQTRRLRPTFKVGERLFIREPFYLPKWFDEISAGDLLKKGQIVTPYFEPNDITGRKRNKRFMPYKFARYFIEIKSVRTERLQDISPADCLLEGVESRDLYAVLFDSIHGLGAWDKNPTIYIYDYEKIEIT